MNFANASHLFMKEDCFGAQELSYFTFVEHFWRNFLIIINTLKDI